MRWHAINRWLFELSIDDENALNIPIGAAAATLWREDYDKKRLGYPRWPHKDSYQSEPVWLRLSPARRQEAERAVAAVVAGWESAGSPHPRTNQIKMIYQSITSSEAFRDKYVTPLADDQTTKIQENAA